MTTLISFLGKGRREKDSSRYQRATYRFDDGSRTCSSYFGLALAEKLQVRKLVILGTAGSIWDVFAEHFADDEAALEKLTKIALDEAVTNETVTQDLLERLAPLAGDKLGMQVRLALIPFARDEAQQIDVLKRMADCVDASEHVVLDVTHGFRHLPMLALVAARFLARVRSVTVEDIYYGALEMADSTTGYAPVLRMKGLLRMLDWVDALATYGKDGDFGDLADLLEEDGLPPATATALRNAAFFERTSNSVRASEALAGAFPDVAGYHGQLGGLFAPELSKRVSWFRGGERADKELALADLYFQRRDYLRAAIYMLESAVTREVFRNKENHNDYDQRDAARRALCDKSEPIRGLNSLRNALAHGLRSTGTEITRALADEGSCRSALASIRRDLPR